VSRRLPACTGHDILRALERGGFSVHHVKGGYHSLQHSEKPALRVVVPVHRKDLPPGTLRSIIKQCQLTEREFIELL